MRRRDEGGGMRDEGGKLKGQKAKKPKSQKEVRETSGLL
jgi:hypothetical protein